MINDSLENAAREVLVLIDEIEPQLKEKIPNEFVEWLNEEASKEYNFIYDYDKKFYEQNTLPLTQGFISYIYVNFLCNETEKKEYMEEYNKVIYEQEMAKKEKYKYEDLFENNKKIEIPKENDIIENSKLPVKIEKKNFFTKVFSKLRDFFYRR